MASVDETVEANLGLAYHQLHRFQLIDDPDAVSYAFEGLFIAASTYKQSSGNAFSTYAVCVIANHIRKYLRTCNKKRVIIPVSYHAPLYADKDGEELLMIDILEGPDHAEDKVLADERSERINKALDAVYNELSVDSHKTIFKLWVESDFSMKQRELVQSTGLSQPYVSRVLSSIKHKLRLELEDYIYERRGSNC